MRQAFLPLLLVSLLFAGDLHAAKSDGHKSVSFSPDRFAEQREAVIEDMSADTYRELSDSNREEVLKALARMADKLEGISHFNQLDKRDQTALFNDQELINNLLTEAAADSRLICKREKFVGSNRTTNVCVTVAERRRLTEVAQEQMRQMQGSGYMKPEGADMIPARPSRGQ